MLLSRDTVLQGARSLGNTSGPGQTGIAAAARFGDNGSPPGSVDHRLEHFFTLFLPAVVVGFGNSWDAPGAKHSLVHGASQSNRRVAGGESQGEGDNWNATQTASHVDKVAGGYQINNVRKSYVTSAGKATHYQFACRVGADTPQSDRSALFVERDKIEWEIVEPWNGLGLRGNNSSPVRFNGFVPEENRLGAEHTLQRDTGAFNRPVVTLTYAAAYLGIASGAYELACQEISHRFPSGSRRLDRPVNQRRIAEMGTQIEAARALLHAACSVFDQDRAPSQLVYSQAKVACSEAGVRVTEDCMSIFGGTAFASRLPFERYFRDARAGLVMGMANDMAYEGMIPLMFPES